nr:PREDICTED: uncharacterized protein LOC105676396 isoform X1 [Linepithema humile]
MAGTSDASEQIAFGVYIFFVETNSACNYCHGIYTSHSDGALGTYVTRAATRRSTLQINRTTPLLRIVSCTGQFLRSLVISAPRCRRPRSSRSRRGNSSGSEDYAGGRAFRFHDRRCRARRIHPAGVPSLTTGNTQVLLAIKTLPRTAYPSSVNLLHSGDKNGTAMHLRAASHILEPS